jgi:intracellular septation protein A
MLLPGVACTLLTSVDFLQVSKQRWLTVGAILVFGGAGLLAADSVSGLIRAISAAD